MSADLTEELGAKVDEVLSQTWNMRDGNVVPSQESVALEGGAVRLEGTVLYADLAQSSMLATEFQQRTAAKVIRSFLYCMCRLISEHGGTITAFDGDRVMGIFVGDLKNSRAATCALKMNYVVTKIIEPKVTNYFTSLDETQFEISHCVGVDTSSILAIRAGQRGANDLVWVGRAPNLAARLSEIREQGYRTYISDDVFQPMNQSAKYGGEPQQLMWENRAFKFIGESITVHRSGWTWRP